MGIAKLERERGGRGHIYICKHDIQLLAQLLPRHCPISLPCSSPWQLLVRLSGYGFSSGSGLGLLAVAVVVAVAFCHSAGILINECQYLHNIKQKIQRGCNYPSTIYIYVYSDTHTHLPLSIYIYILYISAICIAEPKSKLCLLLFAFSLSDCLSSSKGSSGSSSWNRW